jgi:hypothetical protein
MVRTPAPSATWISSLRHGVVNPQPSTIAMFQAEVPPVGLVELTSRPLVSAATHSDTEGHAIEDSSGPPGSIVVLLHVFAAGSVDTSTVPSSSTARQSEIDGQATLRKKSRRYLCVHGPLPGCVVVRMCVSFSASATHRVGDGHAPSSNWGVVGLTLQAAGPPDGSVDV